MLSNLIYRQTDRQLCLQWRHCAQSPASPWAKAEPQRWQPQGLAVLTPSTAAAAPEVSAPALPQQPGVTPALSLTAASGLGDFNGTREKPHQPLMCTQRGRWSLCPPELQSGSWSWETQPLQPTKHSTGCPPAQNQHHLGDYWFQLMSGGREAWKHQGNVCLFVCF